MSESAKSRKDDKLERKKKRKKGKVEESEDVTSTEAIDRDGEAEASGEEDGAVEQHSGAIGIGEEKGGDGDGDEGADEGADEDCPSHPGAAGDSNLEAGNKGSNPALDSSLSLPAVGENPVKFLDLGLSAGTQKAISAMGFETMTEVQSRTIPPLMAGRDVCLPLSPLY